MTTPIDSIRKSAPTRSQASKAKAGEPAEPPKAGLPVPVRPASTPAHEPPAAAAPVAAHLIGQDGAKRGLRGGPALLGAAKAVYQRTEWSGSKDRRARKGGRAKTEI